MTARSAPDPAALPATGPARAGLGQRLGHQARAPQGARSMGTKPRRSGRRARHPR